MPEKSEYFLLKLRSQAPSWSFSYKNDLEYCWFKVGNPLGKTKNAIYFDRKRMHASVFTNLKQDASRLSYENALYISSNVPEFVWGKLILDIIHSDEYYMYI